MKRHVVLVLSLFAWSNYSFAAHRRKDPRAAVRLEQLRKDCLDRKELDPDQRAKLWDNYGRNDFEAAMSRILSHCKGADKEFVQHFNKEATINPELRQRVSDWIGSDPAKVQSMTLKERLKALRDMLNGLTNR